MNIKLTFDFFKQRGKQAGKRAKELYVGKLISWAESMRRAWKEIVAKYFADSLLDKKIKILSEGVVTFVKKTTGEITTRRIIPIGQVSGYRDFNPKFPGLFVTIDADKYTKTGVVATSIIQFYLQNIL